MTKDKPKNVAASVRQRLLNIARRDREDFQLVLTRYAIERLLFRLSLSRYRDQFILKGAMLFQLWGGGVHRPTRDLDLLGQGSNQTTRLAEIFREICNTETPDDGLLFKTESARAEEIKPDEEYQGIRVYLDCLLENARVQVQIDIGFGDAVTPAPTEIAFPTVLDFPAPMLKAYPKETVVSEKLQAMVALGIVNSRMKDFYDVWFLSTHFNFDGPLLSQAIAKTFERRSTGIPKELPVALSDQFAADSTKQTQLQAFMQKGQIAPQTDLPKVVKRLREYLGPVLAALGNSTAFSQSWIAGQGWS